MHWLDDFLNLSQQETQAPNTQKMANGQPYQGPIEQGLETPPEQKLMNGLTSLASGYYAPQVFGNLLNKSGMMGKEVSSIDSFSPLSEDVQAMVQRMKDNGSSMQEMMDAVDSKVAQHAAARPEPLTPTEGGLLANLLKNFNETGQGMPYKPGTLVDLSQIK